MNQTKKRLSIINLAIPITDIETIQLQVLKLRLLQTDEKVQDILNMLQNENFAQAQNLIKSYIDTPNKEILQRTFQKAQALQQKKEKELKAEKEKNQEMMDTANLFVQSTQQYNPQRVRTLDLNDMLEMAADAGASDPGINPPEMLHETPSKTSHHTPKDAPVEIEEESIFSMEDHFEEITPTMPTMPIKKKESARHTVDLNEMMAMEEAHHVQENQRKVHETVNFDDLLSVNAEDILPDNIEIDISHGANSDFWEGDASQIDEEETRDSDSFFDETIKDDFNPITIVERTAQVEASRETEPATEQDSSMEMSQSDEAEAEEDEALRDEFFEPKVAQSTQESKKDLTYKAISYIDQKLKNMQVQYPLVQPTNVSFKRVDTWLETIANSGYTEEEVVATFQTIDEIQTENNEEAALLLLTSAATESKYAQFRLARALYKGELLEQNVAEAFTLINRLAVNEDYPEAICDLGQFYEHGIGIDKDRNKALTLYEEAMQAGIQRAGSHVERLTKQNKGLFSFLKK